VWFGSRERKLGFVELVDFGGFKFPDFREALKFVNLVGELAEEQGHQGRCLGAWGKVEITTWTHKINVVLLNYIPSVHLLLQRGEFLILERRHWNPTVNCEDWISSEIEAN
jgi:Pterin 4 alpha carbinolamine dehydratase